MYHRGLRPTYFLLGASATLAQVVLLREFMVVYFGSELCLGLVLAVWLLGVFGGASTAGRIGRSIKSHRAVVLVSLLLLSLSMGGCVYLTRILRHILVVPVGELIPFLKLVMGSLPAVMPVSFAAGFVFPFACAIVHDGRSGSEREGTADVTLVYVWETVGSMTAGLVYTFLLVTKVSPFSISAALLTLNALNGLFFLRSHLRGVCFFPALLGILLQLFGICAKLDEDSVISRWKSFNPNQEFVESIDSRYQNLGIGKFSDQYNIFTNGDYAFSFPAPYESAQAAHLYLCQHPAPRSVLLLGGGPGGMVREMLKHDLKRLTYVELDPRLVPAIRPYLSDEDREALEDPTVEIVNADGRFVVKNAEERYDMVIVNLPEPSSAALNRYFTREFCEEVRRVLNPGGVLVTGAASSSTYIGDDLGNYLGSAYNTVKSVFEHVAVTPGEESHFFACDSPGVVTVDPKTLTTRYLLRAIESDTFSHYVFDSLLTPYHVEFIEKELAKRSDAPVNTDLHPVMYYYRLILWDRFSGNQLAGIMRWVEKLGMAPVALLICALLTLRLLWVRFRKPGAARLAGFNSYVAIGTTGMSAMAFELALLYAYQNVFGYLYHDVGLIVALFMSGLAVGAMAGQRLVNRSCWNAGKLLLVTEGVVLAYALGLAALLPILTGGSGAGVKVAFLLLTAGAGVLVGGEFPMAVRVTLDCSRGLVRSAGRLDAADHLGASVGALLTGVVLIPVWGMVPTMLLVALIKLSSVSLLGVDAFTRYTRQEQT
ncbi:hypothetical protein ACFL1X_06885 [Candidatus Hydrogenedentota bacterium]